MTPAGNVGGHATASPADVLWRVLARLREDRELVEKSREELHPERHKDVVDALHEVEQLLNTQINLLGRIQRRYGSARG